VSKEGSRLGRAALAVGAPPKTTRWLSWRLVLASAGLLPFICPLSRHPAAHRCLVEVVNCWHPVVVSEFRVDAVGFLVPPRGGTPFGYAMSKSYQKRRFVRHPAGLGFQAWTTNRVPVPVAAPRSWGCSRWCRQLPRSVGLRRVHTFVHVIASRIPVPSQP